MLFKCQLRFGEVALSVKLVKDPSSIPNTHLKAACDEMCPESQHGDRMGSGSGVGYADPWRLLASRSSLIDKPKVPMVDSVSKNKRGDS